jgi:serine/threonine-protein kinase
MLQPDPRDRPTSMAHIAGATIPPPSADRSAAQARGEGWPPISIRRAPMPATPPSRIGRNPRAGSAVRRTSGRHICRNPSLSQRPAVKSPGVEARKHSAGPLIAAGLGVLALAAGAGAYLTGLISLRDEIRPHRTTTLSPSPDSPAQGRAGSDHAERSVRGSAQDAIAPPPEPAPSAQANTETPAQPARLKLRPVCLNRKLPSSLPQTAKPAPVTPAPVAPPKETATAPKLQPAPPKRPRWSRRPRPPPQLRRPHPEPIPRARLTNRSRSMFRNRNCRPAMPSTVWRSASHG